ncbi:MAG: response regulator, partial [Candidatus Sericytochromatia bacterium]
MPENEAALIQEIEPPAEQPSWKVLVVDDDQDIHSITRLALKSFRVEGKPLLFLHAYSASEAEVLLQQHPDVAVVLLDVVMESNQAGLSLVDYIRHNLNNDVVRIIVRTGQPGEAPETRVLEDYKIDDYRLKTELTQSKLHSILMASIRTYEAMLRGEAYRQSLERK